MTEATGAISTNRTTARKVNVTKARRWRLHLRPVFGLVILSVIVLSNVLAPVISSRDPLAQDLDARLVAPSWRWDSYLLGSDQLGRDLFTRILYGGRVSLVVAFSAVGIAGFLGVLLGLLSGYFAGYFETVTMSIADIQLALPFVLFAIVVIATLGAGLPNIILVLSLSGWVVFARLTRVIVISLKSMEFILAARSIGASDFRILVRHILPNTLTLVVAIVTPAVARMILAESALSFLGLSVQPSIPTWGGMLSDARDYVYRAPWMGVFPGLAIMITVLGVNFIGDWLRQVLNPSLRQR